MPELKTIKKILFIIIYVLSGSVIFCSKSEAQNHKKIYRGSEITHSLIDEEILRNQIDFLCDTICGGRRTGAKGSSEAIFWISRRFRQIGLRPVAENTYIKHFMTDRGTVGRNLIGCLPGSSKSFKRNYILVVSHFDGLGVLNGNFYPGADNNASGVVAMLGVAEMLKAMTRFGKVYGRNIIFAALDAKEVNMGGAKALWELISGGCLKNPETGEPITSDRISFMVNIDQIGSSLSPLKSGRKDYMLMLGEDMSYSCSTLLTANSQYNINLDLAFDYYGSKDFTKLFYRKIGDHKIFIENGIPAVLFTSGITMNNNKTYDKPDSLNIKILKKRIWLIFHWLEKII